MRIPHHNRTSRMSSQQNPAVSAPSTEQAAPTLALDPAEDERRKAQLRERGNLPRHIAIIMDGDRRWAQRQNLPRTEGHRFGKESVRDVVRACGQLQIPMLTLYTFSTENWSRPRHEVTALMKWLREALSEEVPELDRNHVRLHAIGELEGLPRTVRMALKRALERTRDNTGLQLNLALNYGGRAELVQACRTLALRVQKGELAAECIDEEALSGALYTAGMPDPDLLIRPSGEMRLSNFLPWQMVYTEIYFATDVLWPDFRRQHLYTAIDEYQRRQRRFGGT